MESFNQYLMSNFKASIREVSKTDEGNIYLKGSFLDNYFMISLDEMAKRIPNFKFKGDTFSSADGFFIEKKDSKFIFHFFEFKNLDFSNIKDYQLSSFNLNKCIAKIKDCSNKNENCKECNIVESFDKLKKHLIDEVVCSLRSKPYDSLSTIYHFMECYFKEDVSNKLFSTNKVFYLVSLTDAEYNSPNKSNNHRKQFTYFSFLKRIAPYHFNEVRLINNRTFMGFFSKIYKNRIIN